MNIERSSEKVVESSEHAEGRHDGWRPRRSLASRALRGFFKPLVIVPGIAVAAAACSLAHHEGVTTGSQAVTAPGLGTSQAFAVLAGSTVTNTGPTVVSGDLGVSPGSAITGFPPGSVVGGTIEDDTAVALQAQSDTTTAYNTLAGEACNTNLTGQDLGGLTLTAGTYCFSSSAQLTGTLTLDAQGDPAAVFVFQIGSTLTTASNASVQVINGGSPCNVFWQVGSSATLGTGTSFEGSILALTSITLTTGVAVEGRALARNGAVTMDTNNVDAASCQQAADGGSSSGSSSSGSASSGSAGSGSTSSGSAGSGSASSGSASSGSTSSGSASSGSADAGVDACADAGVACDKALCSGQCVDLQTDCSNCGSCGNVCGPSQSCVNGACCAGNSGSADAGTPPPPPACTNGFSGRAMALVADVGNGVVHVTAGDTGPLPSGGGDLTASTAGAMIPGLLTAQILHSETSGAGSQAHSDVSTSLSLGLANLGPVLDGLGLTNLVNGLGLGNLLGGLLGLPPALVLPNVSVDVLSADSTASCSSGGTASVQGTSTLANLMIGGTPIDITGAPNQTITIGPLTIIINEQTSSASGGAGSIDVRALHVELSGLLDVVVSDAAADITCQCPANGNRN